MAIPPTDDASIQILLTNYDIITDFLNLAFCSENFISIKHRILAIMTACMTLNKHKEINLYFVLLSHHTDRNHSIKSHIVTLNSLKTRTC